jgi:hypothetical protein
MEFLTQAADGRGAEAEGHLVGLRPEACSVVDQDGDGKDRAVEIL